MVGRWFVAPETEVRFFALVPRPKRRLIVDYDEAFLFEKAGFNEGIDFVVKKCAYVEFVVGYENNILEFPCQNERVYDLFCEEHKEFANSDYNFSALIPESELFDDDIIGHQLDTIAAKMALKEEDKS